MFKKWNLLALALSALMLAPTLASAEAPRPPIAEKVQAYSGPQGVQVWTLRIGERSANEALVQVTGIDHDWDKRIQKMTVEKTFKDVRYSTLVNGKPYIALIINQGYGELYLPGESKSVNIQDDDDLAAEGNAEYFLTDYLQQSDSK